MRVRVNGIPAPQGSKSFVGRAGGRGLMVESSKAVGPWREAVRAETQRAIEAGQIPLAGALDVLLTFWMPRPRGHYGKRGLLPSAPMWPAVRPDLDKLARSALDGLVAGGAIADDARIVRLTAEKAYADDDTPTGMTARIDRVAAARSHATCGGVVGLYSGAR